MNLVVRTDIILLNSLLMSYVVYFSQGILYTQGSFLSQLALLSIFSICFIYVIKSLIINQPKIGFFKVWTVFLFINIIGFAFSSALESSEKYGMFKGVLLTLISLYPFYYMGYRNIEIRSRLIYFLMVMLALSIAQFYNNYNTIISERIRDNTDVVNNSAYLFVSLIPFIFFIKRKIVSISLLAICAFFIINGAKRGALFAGTLGLITYIIYFVKDRQVKSKIGAIKLYLFGGAGLLAIGFLLFTWFSENEFLQSRLEQMLEGNDSNRSENYMMILDAWLNSDSFFNLIFGFGFASSLDITGRHFAHNDWLEALSNFGLMGLLLYFLLFFSLFFIIQSKVFSLRDKYQLISIALIWFFITLVSMFYTSLNSFLIVIVFGNLLGVSQKAIHSN